MGSLNLYNPSDCLSGAILGAVLFGISTMLAAGSGSDTDKESAHFYAAAAGLFIVFLFSIFSAVKLVAVWNLIEPAALVVLVLIWVGAEIRAYSDTLPIQEVAFQLEQLQFRLFMATTAGARVELDVVYETFCRNSALAAVGRIADLASIKVSRQRVTNSINLLVDAVKPTKDKFKQIVHSEVSEGRLFVFRSSTDPNEDRGGLDDWPEGHCYVSTNRTQPLIRQATVA